MVKRGKENLYLIGNQDEMWYAADKHIYACHTCAKGFLDY